jgi:hypothetical protein
MPVINKGISRQGRFEACRGERIGGGGVLAARIGGGGVLTENTTSECVSGERELEWLNDT